MNYEIFLATRGTGEDVDYKAQNQKALEQLDALENPPVLKTDAQYRTALAISNALCSLSCYTSNTSHPEDSRVWRLEAEHNAVIAKYVKKHFVVRDAATIDVMKYAISDRYFKNVRTNADYYRLEVVPFLAARKLFAISAEGNVFVLGLKLPVGNNVFRRLRNGGVGRQLFGHVALPQAFRLAERYCAEAKLLDLPTLSDDVRATYLSSDKGTCGKGSARTPKLDQALPGRLTRAFQKDFETEQAERRTQTHQPHSTQPLQPQPIQAQFAL